MKKYVVSLLLFLPMVAFGAPSVRMLGNQPALSAAISSGAKVTPVKASNETGSVSSSARIGTLSSKSKLNNLSSANGISSASRFPVIQPAYSYNSVSVPQTGGSSGGSYGSGAANVNVAEIIDAVTQNIERNYYDTEHVYNNDDFVEAVQNVIDDNDDPRFDAIKVSNTNPRTYWESKGLSLPTNYVYIWIEENN